jgi:hypothetical protein
VLEAAQGTSVFGQNFQERYPVKSAGASADPLTYFHDLVYASSEKIGAALAAGSAAWRKPDAAGAELVTFTVRTTIDDFIDGLEHGVRAPNSLLDEMRRVVGGVTVELDGAAVGSSPGAFKASPGMHQLRITRQWMQPWQRTVQIYEGAEFNIGLEFSTEGLAKFKSLEGFRALTALTYAEAAYLKGITINFDTANWRDVYGGGYGRVHLERTVIQADEDVNRPVQPLP